jgi:hypothetical protein
MDDYWTKLLAILAEPAFTNAPNDEDLLRMGYERPFKVLGDGRIAAIMHIDGFTEALVVGIHPWGHDHTYYYRHGKAAQALAVWNGEHDPDGWIRHPQTGRRRPDGDASKEYVWP